MLALYQALHVVMPQGGSKLRCCPTATYPDVVVLADRGAGVACGYDASAPFDWVADWSTAKEFLVMPGGCAAQGHAYCRRAWCRRPLLPSNPNPV